MLCKIDHLTGVELVPFFAVGLILVVSFLQPLGGTRPHWLAGARGFEPPSCRNCVLPTPCTRRRLPPLLGSQCNAPRAPAATPRMRAKGGASGKRIHGAIWHIGEAGAALTTVRLARACRV